MTIKPRSKPRRGSYAAAIAWIADNDDSTWVDDLDETELNTSVTASMVADVFGRTCSEVAADLRRVLKRCSI